MNFEIETQLSITLENHPGQIALITDILAKSGVHIGAISMSEKDSIGEVRVITCDSLKASEALEHEGFEVVQNQVLSISLQDSKGRLADLTKALASASINIDYVYATVSAEGNSSRVVLKVSNIPMASRILTELATAA